MLIKNLDLQLDLLSQDFFVNKAPMLNEILEKDHRPYCVLLVQVKNLHFALPLRTNLPQPENDKICFKTIHNDKGGYKGIDFTKAIIVDLHNDIMNTNIQLRDKQEFLCIQGNVKKIIRNFKKFVERYITEMKNSPEKLSNDFQFCTLINYHSELKIKK
ncbi:type III toxin-antitoxin system TenpIN family toxin [Gallibacterium melopsittaci]|uniref:Type III toxin-antitoxin system TenpIN family toxin n=1 Tax=Gallibacterium melopsittaci TaxID=516063 RepID=A0ABV6HY31_9PAST